MSKRVLQIITGSFIGLACSLTQNGLKAMEDREGFNEARQKEYYKMYSNKDTYYKYCSYCSERYLVLNDESSFCCKAGYINRQGERNKDGKNENTIHQNPTQTTKIEEKLGMEEEERLKREQLRKEEDRKKQMEEKRRRERERERQELIRQSNINNTKKDVIPDTEELYRQMLNNMRLNRSIITTLDPLEDL